MSHFLERFFCPNCGAVYCVMSANPFFLDSHCHECGLSKNGFVLKLCRSVSDAKWWNPLTWHKRHWETPDGHAVVFG